MLQIIQENRKPTTAERFNAMIQTGLNQYGQYQQQQQLAAQAQKLSQLTGMDLRGLSPELQQEAFKQAMISGAKQRLNPLQQAQADLAKAKLGQTESQNKLFNQLIGSGNKQQSPNQEIGAATGSPLESLNEQELQNLAAFAGQPGQQGILGNIAQAELDRKKEKRKEETTTQREYFKINEPKLLELSDTQRKLETEAMRYDRLENLFQDPSKFPSSFTAALFSKDGQINDIVYSQLTPEAQEALKLIIDSTSNIKDTYGARVTNFDLQTYLKKLPSLLNTPEGKMRVLRDLKIMNELNRMHAQGIQDIFEEHGGSNKIPFSKAEAIYNKKYKSLEEDLKRKFISPEKTSFKDLPDPVNLLGRKIKNPETGEIFISDGKEWKPFKG